MRYVRTRRPALLVLASIVGVLVAGCAESPPSTTPANPPRVAELPADEPTVDPQPEPLKPAPMTCDSRSALTIDYAALIGEPDLQTAFDGYAEPGEAAVIVRRGHHGAVARYVDKAGGAQAVAKAYRMGHGWLIETVERCA